MAKRIHSIGGGGAASTVVSTSYVYGPNEIDQRTLPAALTLTHDQQFTSGAALLVHEALSHEQRFSLGDYAMGGPGIMCSKDAWVDTNLNGIGGAADTANHNSTVLRVARESGLSTVAIGARIGFDLSNFPTGATITSAQLVLHRVGGSEALTTGQVSGISSANEGWSEATLVCTNAPSASVVFSTFAGTTVDLDTAIDITAASTYIANRMGTTVTCSFIVSAVTTGTTMLYFSKDGPTSTALGPRLRLRFTVTG